MEAENRLSAHQTGNNSGVIQSGLYYKPGSLKAKNCSAGRDQLYEFCRRHDIPFEKCGKIVVATKAEELPGMEKLLQRGAANGLKGIKKISQQEILEIEPAVKGIAGLFVPQTGIVDFIKVTEKYAEIFKKHQGTICLNTKVLDIRKNSREIILETTGGEILCKNLINCAGLQSDRLAKKCGLKPGLKIIPFRGEYYELVKEKRTMVKNLIYPVPDPRFPFLGVHFTRMIDGTCEAGPNAVLALKREGYKKSSFSLKDNLEMISYPGFWKMCFKFWKVGIKETARSFSKRLFLKSLQRIIPQIQKADIFPGGAGVRAQALEPGGALVDDFRIIEKENMVHVLNAPSPAATASLNIGRSIAQTAIKNFNL